MSEENVELVRRLFDMFANRDHEQAFALYDPEIEWIAASGPFPDSAAGGFDDLQGTYHGHDGVRTYWRRWLQAWSDLDFELQDVIDRGDEVVALVRNQRQWGARSGIVVEMPPYGLIFTFRDGKVVRWRSYPDQESALAAAGITEDTGP
jgi:ketosteroid isomerase-like protein